MQNRKRNQTNNNQKNKKQKKQANKQTKNKQTNKQTNKKNVVKVQRQSERKINSDNTYSLKKIKNDIHAA
jgi:hypothetical protein